MKELINYALKDYLQQGAEVHEEYRLYLKYLPAKSTKKQIHELKLKHVEEIKVQAQKTDIEAHVMIICLCDKKQKEDIYNYPIVEFFSKLNFVKENLERIISAEKIALTSKHVNIKFEQVDGASRLQKFGIYNTLDQLADGDILKYRKILNLKYSEVFAKLNLDRVKADIMQDMNNIKDKKNV